jgi:hypothetical protein
MNFGNRKGTGALSMRRLRGDDVEACPVMNPEDYDEQRIIRIARALCRSARIDPDAPIDERTRPLLPEARCAFAEPSPAWMAFRDSARAFASRYPREIVSSL